ncbi:hypothetical protein M0R45_006327 [Rubus argutus]|uniref:Uncharacterized protein n=1 Tax=Rubus argutus TaxID=59490 RepID=A0AAW1YQU3_RUBAR
MVSLSTAAMSQATAGSPSPRRVASLCREPVKTTPCPEGSRGMVVLIKVEEMRALLATTLAGDGAWVMNDDVCEKIGLDWTAGRLEDSGWARWIGGDGDVW